MRMVDEFWRLYNQCLFAYNYHELERNYYKKCLTRISVLSYIVTAISLAGWGFTSQYAVFWSVVIFFSQVTIGLKDQFGINKRVWMLEAYLNCTAVEIAGIAKTWRLITLGRLTEDEILKRTNSLTLRFMELECQYIRPHSLGDNKKLIEKADVKTNAELEAKHGRGEQYAEQTIATNQADNTITG